MPFSATSFLHKRIAYWLEQIRTKRSSTTFQAERGKINWKFRQILHKSWTNPDSNRTASRQRNTSRPISRLFIWYDFNCVAWNNYAQFKLIANQCFKNCFKKIYKDMKFRRYDRLGKTHSLRLSFKTVDKWCSLDNP